MVHSIVPSYDIYKSSSLLHLVSQATQLGRPGHLTHCILMLKHIFVLFHVFMFHILSLFHFYQWKANFILYTLRDILSFSFHSFILPHWFFTSYVKKACWKTYCRKISEEVGKGSTFANSRIFPNVLSTALSPLPSFNEYIDMIPIEKYDPYWVLENYFHAWLA